MIVDLSAPSRFAQIEWIPEGVRVNDYEPISVVYREAMGADFAKIAIPIISGVVRRHLRAWDPPLRHLDIACGTGDILIGLGSELATAPIGIDICDGQLGAADTLARAAAMRVSLIRGNALDVAFPAQLDLVTMNLDALNHLTSLELWITLFDKVRHALRPGGLFVFDVNTPERLSQDWQYPEVIVKPSLTYVQCGLDSRRDGELVWQKLLMIIYSAVGATSTRHAAVIEQLGIPTSMVLRLAKESGLSVLDCCSYESRAEHAHIFLKNRDLIVCQTPYE